MEQNLAADTTQFESHTAYEINELCRLLDTYLDKEQVKDVYRAFLFGAQAHEGQTRLTGEPYITHPIAVARILAEMHMDAKSIMAAILHDVIEDTPTAKDQLAREFGDEVAEMVDGVSKLSHIQFESKAEAQAENFRKMVLAMARDIRVMLVKLADRLHNMRTLGVMPPAKRRRIARETLEIYSPIASRLGINTMRVEFEDLGFQALYPARHRVISESVRKARGNRKEIVGKIEATIKKRLEDEGLTGRVLGREKHLYSIYLKMRAKRLSFSDVMDVYAFRIVVDSVDTCYRVFGAMHNLYKPVPGRFKDYIAIPKTNGYQSLHTVLFGPHGVPIEIQIRTDDMHWIAESGIAAHWLYKSHDIHQGGNGAQVRAREWVKGLLEMQQNAGNSLEFIENVKIDLFPDAIYVFTPKGDIMELPKGATAVDLAYAVHTGVGNSCIAAKIDRRLAPLRTRLTTGQTVEIVVAPGARPNPAWLNFVVTAKARTNIRHYLKNLRVEDAVNLGRRMVDKALSTMGTALNELPPPQVASVLAEMNVASLDLLFEEVGLGRRMPLLVARALARRGDDVVDVEKIPRSETGPLFIKGTEGMVVTFARCCRPIPGDAIAGFVSAGRGVVIHYQNCKNVAEYRKLPEKWIDVQWEDNIDRDFPAEIRVDVTNQRGVLAKVAAMIAEEGADIENVQLEERDGLVTTLSFVLLVKGRLHLARIMRRLRVLPVVMRITRVRG